MRILASSIVILRTSVLARWAGYVGLASSAIILLATVATFGAYTIPVALLWSVCLGIAIWRRPTTN